jgi:hypothetical protein
VIDDDVVLVYVIGMSAMEYIVGSILHVGERSGLLTIELALSGIVAGVLSQLAYSKLGKALQRCQF